MSKAAQQCDMIKNLEKRTATLQQRILVVNGKRTCPMFSCPRVLRRCVWVDLRLAYRRIYSLYIRSIGNQGLAMLAKHRLSHFPRCVGPFSLVPVSVQDSFCLPPVLSIIRQPRASYGGHKQTWSGLILLDQPFLWIISSIAVICVDRRVGPS